MTVIVVVLESYLVPKVECKKGSFQINRFQIKKIEDYHTFILV